MTDRREAPERLLTTNIQYERERGDNVKLFSAGGRPLCSIHRDDWEAVRDFFKAITARGALL